MFKKKICIVLYCIVLPSQRTVATVMLRVKLTLSLLSTSQTREGRWVQLHFSNSISLRNDVDLLWPFVSMVWRGTSLVVPVLVLLCFESSICCSLTTVKSSQYAG